MRVLSIWVSMEADIERRCVIGTFLLGAQEWGFMWPSVTLFCPPPHPTSWSSQTWALAPVRHSPLPLTQVDPQGPLALGHAPHGTHHLFLLLLAALCFWAQFLLGQQWCPGLGTVSLLPGTLCGKVARDSPLLTAEHGWGGALCFTFRLYAFRLYALLDLLRLAWLSGPPSFRLRSKCLGGVGCAVSSVGRQALRCLRIPPTSLLSDAGAEGLPWACLI